MALRGQRYVVHVEHNLDLLLQPLHLGYLQQELVHIVHVANWLARSLVLAIGFRLLGRGDHTQQHFRIVHAQCMRVERVDRLGHQLSVQINFTH